MWAWKFALKELFPVCPVILLLLFVKLRLHFLCGLYYVPCFCFLQGWPSMSNNPLQQTQMMQQTSFLVGRALLQPRSLPSCRWQSSELSEMKAASELCSYYITTVAQCRQHCWRVRGVSEAPSSQQGIVLCSVLEVPMPKTSRPPLLMLRDKHVTESFWWAESFKIKSNVNPTRPHHH